MSTAPAFRIELAALWTALVAADTAAQLLFKAAAARLDEPRLAPEWIAMVAQSPRVWAALACLLLAFGVWMLVLRRAPLSSSFPVTSLSIVCVVASSPFLFGESVSLPQIAGIGLIIVGVALLRPDRVASAEAAPSISN